MLGFPVSMGPGAEDEDAGLHPGEKVGEYDIVGKLGEGGMGTVWAGVHPVIGKRVAVKVLNSGLSRDAKMVQRFIQEARAVNQIGHRNIVDIFAFGQLASKNGGAGRHYFVMEHLLGIGLKARLAQPDPVSYEEGFNLLAEVCDALSAAHAEGIVHRDLKPDNIFITESKNGDRTVKLLDFGIAKLLLADEAVAQTRTGQPMGTPLYMSPEQCLGKNVDRRTDVYSLGVIMFEMFTGQLPFPGPTYIETVNGHLQTPPPRPTAFADVPDALEALILSCLEKDANRRPQSIAEVRAPILQLAASFGIEIGKRKSGPYLRSATPTPTRRPRATTTAPTPPARKRLPPAVIYLLVAVLTASLATVGVLLLRPRGPVAAPAAAPVALQVVTTPPGATVTIDGKGEALLTPSLYQVPRAPAYEVRVELADYAPETRTVLVAADRREQALQLTLTPLKPATGRLNAHTNVKRPTWLLDGRPIADGAERLEVELLPGRHELRVEAKGYEPYHEPFELHANEIFAPNWTLSPLAKPGHTKKAPAAPAPAPARPKPADDDSWPPK
jgi:serine/threonine-protein kinase